MIDVRGKRVFLSGPMSDDPETYHLHDFADAHLALKRAGVAEVYDPAIEWLMEYGPTRSHEDYMCDCLHALTGDCWKRPYYDMLVSIPGWHVSEGAKHERLVAAWCGIPCYELKDVVE